MTPKAKREISSQISQILKENQFYRLDGKWNTDTLHIGIQPNGLFSPDFSNEVAETNFRKIIKQIKTISNVKKAKSDDWCSGWKVLSGIKIYV